MSTLAVGHVRCGELSTLCHHGSESCRTRDNEIVSTVICEKSAKPDQALVHYDGMQDNYSILFPVKLHHILGGGFESIISWAPNGKCFKIHSPQEFVQQVLPRWFRQSKFGSFQRQLNLYGFVRRAAGQEKGSYHHAYFLRERPELAHFMVRGTQKRSTAQETKGNLERRSDHCKDRPVILQRIDYSVNRKHSRVSFPFRLHMILDEADQKGQSSIISWATHGRCFAIHKQKEFLVRVMPQYFRRAKLSYFHLQLQQYGFQCLTSGQDEGSYYHEYFIRGKPGLAHYMGRNYVEASDESESGDSNDACSPLPPTNTCAIAIHSLPISFDSDNLRSNSNALSRLHPPENMCSLTGAASTLATMAPMSGEDQSEMEEEFELYRYLVDSRDFLRDSALHSVIDIPSVDNK